VVSLDRTVAFIKSEHIAVLVGDDLYLDMADGCQKFFHKQPGISKRHLGHDRCLVKRGV